MFINLSSVIILVYRLKLKGPWLKSLSSSSLIKGNDWSSKKYNNQTIITMTAKMNYLLSKGNTECNRTCNTTHSCSFRIQNTLVKPQIQICYHQWNWKILFFLYHLCLWFFENMFDELENKSPWKRKKGFTNYYVLTGKITGQGSRSKNLLHIISNFIWFFIQHRLFDWTTFFRKGK